ncbi:uncharacterized protein [Battus philenor]|uniref:uncharacterized protein n=1 Tax=Battus philenor TaxID=42288 RepID=UPI0035CF225B
MDTYDNALQSSISRGRPRYNDIEKIDLYNIDRTSSIFVRTSQAREKSSTVYDQRQTGDFNVQIDVKDVQIIALMKNGKEDYVDYDYAYDYSEMTIKPQNRTTPKPLNGTSASADSGGDKTTIATTVHVEVTTAAPGKPSSEMWNTTITEFTTTSRSVMDASNVTETEKGNITTTDSSNKTSCKKGFVLNNKGECELKLQGTGNALLKLVKLSQKLKLRRENKSSTDD